MSSHRRVNRTTRIHRARPLIVAVVAFALTGVLAGPVGAATPGGRAGAETSKKIVVTGKPLEASDSIGSADDPAIGKQAPTAAGKGFDGQKVTVGATDGKPTIVIFVAHWCPHCQAEIPRIVKLAKQGKLDGVEVQTVATGTDPDLPNYPPSKWLAREKWPFTPVLADDGDGTAMRAFGGPSYPYLLFLDADGKVVARATGELAPKTIAAAAKNLAAGKSVFASS